MRVAAVVFLMSGMAGSALAQNTMPNLPQFGGGPEVRDRGQEPPNQPSLLDVTGTRPIIVSTSQGGAYLQPTIRGTFRMGFRVRATGGDTPFVTIGYSGFRSDFVLDWKAYSDSGARCLLIRDRIVGIEVYSGMTIGAGDSLRSLMQQRGAGSVARATRDTLVSADFDCDQPLRMGDRLTVEVKFYALGPLGWRAARYSFDDQILGTGRR